MAAHGIPPIDLLVVNLYPFEATVAAGADYATAVENIDIGGPAMIRAGAKNHAWVAVVVEPGDYAAVLAELDAADGATTYAFRQRLAAKAFARTAAYDAAVSAWFAGAIDEPFPAWRSFAGRLGSSLRYGENPHQSAALYLTGDTRPGVATARQVQGKELSYNNINDTDAAYELVAEFDPARSRRGGDHQARQPLRRRRGGDARRRLPAGAPVRPGLGLRRHRRAQPPARRRGRGGDRQNLHRGDHRARGERRGDRHRRGEEEPPPAPRRRASRPARAGADGEDGGRRAARPGPRQRHGRERRPPGRHQTRARPRTSRATSSSPGASPSTSSRTPSSTPGTAPPSASAPAR